MFKVRTESLQEQVGVVLKLLDEVIVDSIQEESRSDSLEAKNERRLKCLNIRDKVGFNKASFIDQVSMLSKEDRYTFSNLDSFSRQWERGKKYWMSIAFEALFLPIWWLFSFHSGIFGRYNKAISLRLAFSPLLLLVPYYLGYVPYLFSFGPSGGILYPLFVMFVSIPFFWIPSNPVEIEVLNLLPKPLAHISQAPASPMAISFYASVSPTALLVYAGVVLTVSRLINKFRKNENNKRRGVIDYQDDRMGQ